MVKAWSHEEPYGLFRSGSIGFENLACMKSIESKCENGKNKQINFSFSGLWFLENKSSIIHLEMTN